MARYKDARWNLPEPNVRNWEQVGVAVLMDIRDELKELNVLLHCSNFRSIPKKLSIIANNTKRTRKVK